MLCAIKRNDMVKSNFYKRIFFQILIFLTSSLFLTSCDPMKNILISNKTGQNVQVSIVQDITNPLSLRADSIVKFKLSNSADSSSTRYIYGIGVFSKEELKSFKSMIKQIYIETESDTCVIKGDNLLEFLPQKRKRLFKNELEIKINNCPQHRLYKMRGKF